MPPSIGWHRHTTFQGKRKVFFLSDYVFKNYFVFLFFRVTFSVCGFFFWGGVVIYIEIKKYVVYTHRTTLVLPIVFRK